LLLAALLGGSEGTLHRPTRGLRMILEPLGLLGRVLGPFGRNAVCGIDGVDGTSGKASIAIHALLGVDPELFLALVDAVDGALVDARPVLDADARLGNDVRNRLLLLNAISCDLVQLTASYARARAPSPIVR
jgi:hypothetical protein